MIPQEDASIGLFIAADDTCKENDWNLFHDSGPACGLHLSEVWTIYSFFQLSGFKHFKGFYNGAMGTWLRPYFPKMPSYSQFLKLYHAAGKVVDKNFLDSIVKNGEFIIDSTDIAVCKNVRQSRSRLFKDFAGWIITSSKTTYGFKIHLVINSWKQVVNFAIAKGSISDISMARPLLQSLSGRGLGDRGYVSRDVRTALKDSGLNFITRARKNMKRQNTEAEKKMLSRRHEIESFIWKLKKLIGESFSRFRSWKAASSAITVALASLNIGA